MKNSCLFIKLFMWLVLKFLQKSVKIILKARKKFFIVDKEDIDQMRLNTPTTCPVVGLMCSTSLVPSMNMGINPRQQRQHSNVMRQIITVKRIVSIPVL